jgi:nicotinamidase/pyrazinamidase
MKNILLIVDPQNDFITGSLAVEGAKEKMMKLADYIKNDGSKYDFICVTLDSHPENHSSFKENGGIWPAHCVYDTNGWHTPEYLDNVLREFNAQTCKYVHFYNKGTESDTEEYSIFDNERDGFTLYTQIKELARQEDVYVDVCGIAGDYCVLETIKGLRKFMGDKYIKVLTEYTASIDGGEKLMNYLDNNEMITL